MRTKSPWIAGILATLALLLVVGCGSGQNSPATTGSASVDPPSEATLSRERTIVLGDIEADDPVKKIKRFTPLADHLAANLMEFGIESGSVVIARDIDEMGRYLNDGMVDLYFDSAYPSLAVQELSGTQFIASRWKQGEPTHWSIYITLRDNGITSVEDFVGKVLAFERPDSTGGFVLPAGTLMQQGFTLREVGRPDLHVAPDEIGYYFSQDEQNTVDLLLSGLVAGGGFSNQDYEELPVEIKNMITSFGQTIAVPRQLVSVVPGLDPRLVSKVSDLLIGLDQMEQGREVLENLKKTKKFDALPPDSAASLQSLKALMILVSP